MNKYFKTLKTLNCINIVFLLGLLTTPGNAKIRDLETTRLMSTSGTGIGSILVNEAAFLNPASIYFFQSSNIYYQQGTSSLEKPSAERVEPREDGDSKILVITDTSSILKGAFSYQTQEEADESRTRFTSSASTNMGKNASFGVLYRYTEEDAQKHKVYHQATFGLTYLYNEKLSIGAILVDPFLANKADALAALGIQYNVAQNFIFMADAGANFATEPETENLLRAAVQAQFFSDLFLKYGQFKNKITGLEGTSWGLSWIGPRLSLEYALKESKIFEADSQFLKNEEIKEHSVALSLVF